MKAFSCLFSPPRFTDSRQGGHEAGRDSDRRLGPMARKYRIGVGVGTLPDRRGVRGIAAGVTV